MVRQVLLRYDPKGSDQRGSLPRRSNHSIPVRPSNEEEWPLKVKRKGRLRAGWPLRNDRYDLRIVLLSALLSVILGDAATDGRATSIGACISDLKLKFDDFDQTSINLRYLHYISKPVFQIKYY